MTKETTTKRREIKFIVNKETKENFFNEINKHIIKDKYSYSNMGNIYFDTDEFHIAQHSLSKPKKKIKFRARSYSNDWDLNAKVFTELKTKESGITYKERTSSSFEDLQAFYNGNKPSSFSNEFITNFNSLMKEFESLGEIKPKMLLSYNRYAYKAKDTNAVRITVDNELTYKTIDDFNFDLDNKSVLLPKEYYIIEIKLAEDEPEWLTKALENNKMELGSFSKYEKAYLLFKGKSE